MKLLARLFTYIFHPLLVPSICVYYLLLSNPYKFVNESSTLMLFMVINTVFFPVVCLSLMRLLGFIDSFDVKDRRKRVLPYMAVSFFFIWSYFALRTEFRHEILSDIMLGASIAVNVSLFVNVLFYKISLHTVGMGGMVALLIFSIMARVPIFDASYFLYAGILAAGLVGSSRLILNAHTPREIFGGYSVGFFCMFLAFLL